MFFHFLLISIFLISLFIRHNNLKFYFHIIYVLKSCKSIINYHGNCISNVSWFYNNLIVYVTTIYHPMLIIVYEARKKMEKSIYNFSKRKPYTNTIKSFTQADWYIYNGFRWNRLIRFYINLIIRHKSDYVLFFTHSMNKTLI